MYQALLNILLPPGLLIVVLAVGIVFTRRRFDGAWWVSVTSAMLLVGISTQIFASAVLSSLEIYPALANGQLPAREAQAVVILSADDDYAPEYGKSTVGPMTLVRLRYGAQLARRTGLPILVTGAPSADHRRSMAKEMREILEEDGEPTVTWLEENATDTWENGAYSAAILKAKHIERIYLVTHAWHMPRAVIAFRHAGLEVVPAPTAFRGSTPVALNGFLPSAKAMLDTYFAAHEIAGLLIYRLLASDALEEALDRREMPYEP